MSSQRQIADRRSGTFQEQYCVVYSLVPQSNGTQSYFLGVSSN